MLKTMQSSPRRGTVLALTLLIGAFAGAGVFLSALTGRLDSALLFVGIPCALALGIALLPSAGGWATVFQVTTVLLLLSSALLHEGALCVLIASPLVYGTVALAYAVVRSSRGGHHERLGVLPVLALVALEGAVPGLRVNAEQHAEATRVVAGDCAAFEAALDRGPQVDPDADRGLLLGLAEYPTPVSATGTGLAPGDTWRLAMPAGEIRTRVDAASPGRVEFTVTADSARTTRWVDLHGGSLAWHQAADGCRTEMRLDYTRRLDPSLWFGPVTDTFMDAGARAFLASLD